MKINKHNYEVYFIDYFDGNLSEEDTSLLFSFLDEYPDLKAEFDSFEMHTLTPEQKVTFEDKNILKKPSVNLYNYKTFLIADLENDLDANEKNQLHAFIDSHPYVQFESALFDKTKLNAGTELFTNKKDLKRPVIIPFYVQYKVQFAVAAAVALLLLFSQVFFTGITNEKQIANDTTFENSEQNELTPANSSIESATTKMVNTEKTDKKFESNIDANTNSASVYLSYTKCPIIQTQELPNSNTPLALAFENTNQNVMALLEWAPVEDELYATVVNEVDNPEVQSQLSQITNNTLQKLSSNTVSLDSRRTKSGLLKSWKLQAGNFSITHTKN